MRKGRGREGGGKESEQDRVLEKTEEGGKEEEVPQREYMKSDMILAGHTEIVEEVAGMYVCRQYIQSFQ